jgi:interferon gamma-inducible protein 30
MEADDQNKIRDAATSCAQKLNIPLDKTMACMKSRLGNDLQHANAVLTEQLNPPHNYVPWVTLNGVHTEDINNEALEDLVGLICNAYKVKIIFKNNNKF